MSDDITKRMLSAYEQIAPATSFLTGLFQSPRENFYDGEEVEIDIVRTGEEIAIVVQDLTTGGRYNSLDLYTNKKFKPPIFKEKCPLNAFDMIKRSPGDNPFMNPDYQANATRKALSAISKMEAKIRRSIEFEAASVLQTGIITLVDSAGSELYKIDFKPKASHFATTGVLWNNSAAVPLVDLGLMTGIIRKDGKVGPDQIIMGSAAFDAFISNDSVKEVFDNRRIDLGTISPVPMRSDGGVYKGAVSIGAYRLDVWTYEGFYEDPQTSDIESYIHPWKVIVRAAAGRMDATYGGIPTFGNPAAGILPFLPPRLSRPASGMDLFVNAWLTESREQLIVSAGSRPLLIPTAIDTFGCLTVGPV